MVEAPSLPDLDTLDIAALKALVLAQQKQHAEALRSHTSEIEHLKLQVEKLRRMLFGTSSEKIRRRIEQLEFELEELEALRCPRNDASSRPRAVRYLLGSHTVNCCLRICHAKSAPMLRATTPALTAAASSNRWAKMWPRCWSTE